MLLLHSNVQYSIHRYLPLTPYVENTPITLYLFWKNYYIYENNYLGIFLEDALAQLIKSAIVNIGGNIDVFNTPIQFHKGHDIGLLPTLYDFKGYYVKPVNLWFIHLVSVKGLQDLSSYSRALLRYWKFIEEEELEWDHFPPVKALKPTYLFRNKYLLPMAKSGLLAYSTANTYMSHVVQFYSWAYHEKYIDITDKHKPFEVEFINIYNSSMLAHLSPKMVVQTTDLRIKVPRDASRNQINALNPLTQNELKMIANMLQHESVEFRLMCILSMLSGLRIKEVCSFTLNALENAIPTSDIKNRFHVKIGPVTGVLTKFNKTRTIEISNILLSQLLGYSLSERRLQRKDKTKFISQHEPLFISQRGNYYTSDSMQTLWSKFRKRMQSHYKIHFNHRFHDLRASYGTYRLNSLLETNLDASEALNLLMGWMGHNHENTTWKYLRYLKREEALKDKISMLDSIVHEALTETTNEQ